MLSRFRKWFDIDRSDEEFLIDASDPESRQKKIQKLRHDRSRLYRGINVMGFILIVMMLLQFGQYPPPTALLFSLWLVFLLSFSNIDSQLKLLLLLDKTST